MSERPPTEDAAPSDASAPQTPASRRAALRERFRPTDAAADESTQQMSTAQKHLLTGSSVLVIGAAVQGLAGLVFSLLVAQWDTKVAFGDASALYTSVLFVTFLAGLGLPVALARYAADRSIASDVIFTWAVVATACSALVASAFYLTVIHPKAAHVLWDWSPVGGFALFALVVMGSAFSLIFDVRCMTLRRWNLVLARIGAVSILKVAILPLGQDSPHRSVLIFLFLGGPVAISGFLGVIFVNRITGGRHRLTPKPPTARAATHYSAVNYVSTLAYQAPYFALPVIVLINVSSAVNSSFYVAWGIVAIAFYVPSAIGQALLAEGGKDGAHVRSQLHVAMALAVAIMAVGTVASFVGQSVVIAAYGKDYADAAHILPMMMGAGIPWAMTSLYLTEARIMHRNLSTVIITTTLTLAIIVPALILVPGHGPGHGLDGAAKAWLGGNVVAAIVAFVVTAIGRRTTANERAVAELDPLLPVA